MPFVADLPPPSEPPAIVVTAERAPAERDRTPVTVSIADEARLDRIGAPLLPSILRLLPSVAVAQSGPAGSITEVRIRGAEANHTLLFIDGIRANDPAAGNIPRFELLSSDLADRVELARGPQSALWGSEAIGGVIALSSQAEQDGGLAAERGSFGFARLSARAGYSGERVKARAGLGAQRATGIDSFGGPGGDRDGYGNLSVRARADWHPDDRLEFAVTGFGIRARSEYDGYVGFVRGDTADVTRNLLGAVGGSGQWRGGQWTIRGAASILGSRNRNLLDGAFVNQTLGGRQSLSLQAEHRRQAAGASHLLVAAVEAERERFEARDAVYGGATDQKRERRRGAVTAEWRADWGAVLTDLAIRRDSFQRFKDATTLRASALLSLGRGWAATAAFGEGIAQPTFFDLYGFFPGSFIGNPELKPERSRGWELGLRHHSGPLRASATLHRQRLRDEIVDVFLPAFRSTAANATGVSRRWGLEVEAEWELAPSLRLSGNYAYLRADERRVAGDAPVRELRRPKHSGGVVLDGAAGRWTYGASLALSGARDDTDFDIFPARRVTLDPYWLAGARVGFRVQPGWELFGRLANAFDDRFQDVIGYRTEGRSVHVGIRARLGR